MRAYAIMDRTVHNITWIDVGTHNLREHVTMNQ